MYITELYRSVQQVYNNAVCMTVLSLGCCTAMRIFGIVHLLYGVQRDLIIFVHSLRQSYTDVCQGAVQIRITSAWKCHLHHSPLLAVVHCHVHFGIVHLLYEVQWDLIIYVHRLIKSYTYVCQGAVQIRITGARKFRLHHSAHIGVGTSMCILGIVHLL